MQAVHTLQGGNRAQEAAFETRASLAARSPIRWRGPHLAGGDPTPAKQGPRSRGARASSPAWLPFFMGCKSKKLNQRAQRKPAHRKQTTET